MDLLLYNIYKGTRGLYNIYISEGFHKSPYSNRLGPIIMGCGFFIILCAVANLCEVKDSKNRHFIYGDCYNNIIHNAERPNIIGKLNLLEWISILLLY